jgi:alkanesulfonate monooxygenase
MSLRFHCFLPTNGDGRDIVGGGYGLATGAARAIRAATLAYLGQIAVVTVQVVTAQTMTVQAVTAQAVTAQAAS